MFQDFARVWTPVELARRVRRRPVPVAVAGERLVLFRGADGRIAALLDRCPHRGVALSLGRVTPEGTLACPFHGWQFDGGGACVRVPLDPGARCELLRATALPVRELGGLIWLYTAPVADPPEEPAVPEFLTDRRFYQYVLVTHWRCHWTRAMENMLDVPHVPFVHRRTIGFGLSRRMRPGSRLEVTWQPGPAGGRIAGSLDGAPTQSALEFHRPNRMTLRLPVPGRRMYLHIACVPAGPAETRMIVISARDFGRWNPLVRLFDRVNWLIVREDRAIVESSDPPEVPPPGQERSVANDRPTLMFRKYYHEALRLRPLEDT